MWCEGCGAIVADVWFWCPECGGAVRKGTPPDLDEPADLDQVAGVGLPAELARR